jgi:plastocyanin
MKINSWPIALLMCGMFFFFSACSDDDNPTPTCSTPTGLASTPADNSAAVSWTTVSGASSYTVEYKLSTASSYTPISPAPTTNSASITGLAASSTYDWRVRANCATGGSSANATGQFTTLTPLCNAPTGLSSSAITSTEATISWTAVTGAATYDVEYKLSTAGTYTVSNQAGTTKALTGLTPASLYDWRVRTNCTAGGSSSYETGQFTTSAGACNSPTGLASSGITTTDATVSWSAVAGAATYDIEYKLSTAGTYTTFNQTATTKLLTGLTPSSLYDWRVKTNCTAGGSSSYATGQFTTSTPVCPVPTGLASSAITSTGATLSWSAVTGAATYDVEYKLSTAGTYTAFNQAGTSKVLSGLTAGSLYNWRVRTICTAGGTSAYATGNFTTSAAPGTFNISITGFAYSPSSLSVPVGSTVIWTNNDGVPHTVTSTSGAPPSPLNSPTLNNGQTYTYMANTPGTYPYFCTVHGISMSGTLTVTP